MNARRTTLACLLALAALAPAAAARAAQPVPTAPGLFAGVSRLGEELALTGQGAGSVGLPRKRSLAELRFENHDGYTIDVVAFGQTVALSVSRARIRPRRPGDGQRKRRERVSVATYLAHGRVTSSSIEAAFGERGRISVRFRPSGRAVHATRGAGCRQPSDGVLARIGVFVGELSFEGEGGYTSVRVHRAQGRSVDVSALLACLLGGRGGFSAADAVHASAPLGIRLPGLVGTTVSAPNAPAVPTHPSGGPKATTMLAERKEPLTRTVFAAQARGKGRPRFLAAEELSEGSLGIVRLVYARGARSAFSFDDALSSATAAPPAPFSGSGELRRGLRNAKSWSGSLAVSFLGDPHVGLTGDPFGAWLSQGF